MQNYIIPSLPLSRDVESKRVMKKVAEARAALAELKGVHGILPNVGILLNTLALQEAKDSSAVENIITTHDELFRAELNLTDHQYTYPAYSSDTGTKRRGIQKCPRY